MFLAYGKEAVLAATTDRQAARERLIPADESVPLKGHYFADVEDQADELERALCPAYLEERVALCGSARVESGGVCPHCGSDRVYLDNKRVKGTEQFWNLDGAESILQLRSEWLNDPKELHHRLWPVPQRKAA